MEKVEVNNNGMPMKDVVKVDFCPIEGCLLLHKTDGKILKVFVKNK